MYCKKCGVEITDETTNCPQCGTIIIPIQKINKEEKTDEQTHSVSDNEKSNMQISSCEESKKISYWCWGAILSLCCSGFTFYKGVDKMIHYNSGEYYPYESVNAYVGGDAYNYIINGTYATAFFVLTTMFVLVAIGLTIINYVSKK